MSGYKRYPAYRESGVDWLGEIPERWVKKPLKFLSKIVSGSTPKSGIREYWDGDKVWITPADLGACNRKTISDSERKLTDIGVNSCGTEISPAGSIVLSSRAPIGHIALTDVEACINQGCKTVVPGDGVCKDYLYYLLKSGIEELRSCGQGSTFMELPTHRLKDLLIPVPSSAEQTHIAAFLDRKTAQIDRLIEIKRRQIELLKEERTAVINHAVTKGLNPEAKMMESGIEWIGEIPERWKFVELRRLADSLQTGPFGSQLHAEEYVSNGIPIINPSHMKDGRIIPDFNVSVDEKTAENLSRHFLEVGDIVFARRGELGRCGLVTEIERGWLCGTGSLRFRPDQKRVYSPFLTWYLSTGYVGDWLILQSVGSTMDNLNTEILGKVPAPLFPYQEQVNISEKLQLITKEIAETISQAEKQIQLLQEYRTTLISDAVTGKIDVREEAA